MRILTLLFCLLTTSGLMAGESVLWKMEPATRAQVPSMDQADLSLKLDKVNGGGAIELSLKRRQGLWTLGIAKAPWYTRYGVDYDCLCRNLTIDSKGLRGEITVSFYALRDWKAESHLRTTFSLDCAFQPTEDRTRPVLSGTWKGRVFKDGKLQEQIGGGAVTGGLVTPLATERFDRGLATADGLALSFDLGKKRVNWTRYELTRHPFASNQDWSKGLGLRIKALSKTPRRDASLSIWLREEDGSWYYLKDAVPLTQAENIGFAHFVDFEEAEFIAPNNAWHDEDVNLDLTRIREFAVGVINPLGVGTVDFTLGTLEVVADPAPKPLPVQVAVTGQTLAINGAEMVPAGLFGGYAPYLDARFRPGSQRNFYSFPTASLKPITDSSLYHVEMWGDRTVIAPLISGNPLGGKDWRDGLAKTATRFGEMAKEQKRRAVAEFWNEPYLNWAGYSFGWGSAFNYNYFDQSKAVDGGPCTTLGGITIPHFKWQATDRLQVVDAKGVAIKGAPAPAEGAKPGDEVTWEVNVKGKSTTQKGVVAPVWRIYDETKFTYWSGKGIGFVYDEMAEVTGKALKAANPEVTYLVGWGMRIGEDHWAAWDMLMKPSIDRHIAYMDGFHEHHYMGDTTGQDGMYETLTAYCMAKHNKWIPVWNTEVNYLLDAPAKGNIDTEAKAKRARAIRQMIYNLRESLHSVLRVPDKYINRSVIHTDPKNQQDQIAFGLTADLRGRLLETTSQDTKVWCVASLDGSDPACMPPDGKNKLVAFVWNDHQTPRQISVTLNAPAGLTFADGTLEQVWTDTVETFRMEIKKSDLKATGTAVTLTIDLPARLGARIVLPVAGTLPTKATVVRKQYFADDVLKWIDQDKPWQTKVKIPAETLPAPKAWLRLAVESLDEGEGEVLVDGHAVPLPRTTTNDNITRIIEVPMDTSWLKAETPLVIRSRGPQHAGWRCCAASLVVEHREKAGKRGVATFPAGATRPTGGS